MLIKRWKVILMLPIAYLGCVEQLCWGGDYWINNVIIHADTHG